ncbi:MAG: MgtC/SapB family protein [Acidimicrobiia bacterium]|nr:MgtC/SapB family protein [Acidimicrobiia bacterium]
MDDTGQLIQGFLSAAALGAVIGLERQIGRGDTRAHAGARTYALYAAWGASAVFFGDRYGGVAFALALVSFAALVLVSYVAIGRAEGDWGTTSEIGSFVAFVVGALALADQLVVAVAIAVGTAALLRMKTPIYRLTKRFTDDDVRAALQFGVITAVVLPLLPDEDFGPFDAVNVRDIWLMVVFVSGVGFVGYVALRVLGRRGLPLTGLLGGLVSSTAITLGFSRMSKTRPGLRNALVAGILAAGGIMYVRVLVWAYLRSPELGRRLTAPMIVLTVGVVGAALIAWRSSSVSDDPDEEIDVTNPLTLETALSFGALYGVIVFLSKALADNFADASLNIVGAIAGINDVDAITLSTGRLVSEGLDVTIGAQVVLIAVAVNTIVKAAMAMALGSRKLAAAVGTVLGVAALIAVGAWFVV